MDGHPLTPPATPAFLAAAVPHAPTTALLPTPAPQCAVFDAGTPAHPPVEPPATPPPTLHIAPACTHSHPQIPLSGAPLTPTVMVPPALLPLLASHCPPVP